MSAQILTLGASFMEAITLIREDTFNTGVAKHTFCKTCGTKPFYTPRSNPDGVDVNLRCLTPQPKTVRIVNFDGQNWEANAHSLAHKSQ
jgi:hypothetical protein